jgi:hypothetical protein
MDMIIIHNSALAIERFIANSENEQTSNELADVVHGVVAGTESADILMLILMIFLGVLLMLPAAVVVILQVAKRLAPQLMNRPPQYSRSEREKDNDANH